MSLSTNTRGVAAMIISMALFVLNDALMKMASVSMPVSEAVALRGLMAAPFLMLAIWMRGETAHLRDLRDPSVQLRSLFDTLNAMMFLTALTVMPLADDVAIQQIVPLLMTAYAGLVLGEEVGLPRILAVGAGFIGALLVANPSGQGLAAGAPLAFGATLAVAGRDLTTRVVGNSVPSLIMTLSATLILTAGAALFALFEPWRWPNALDLPVLALAAILISGALIAITLAFRWGEVRLIAPLYYSQTVFAVIVGSLVFGAVPKPLALAGMALVVACGLFVLRPKRTGAPAIVPRLPRDRHHIRYRSGRAHPAW